MERREQTLTLTSTLTLASTLAHTSKAPSAGIAGACAMAA